VIGASVALEGGGGGELRANRPATSVEFGCVIYQTYIRVVRWLMNSRIVAILRSLCTVVVAPTHCSCDMILKRLFGDITGFLYSGGADIPKSVQHSLRWT
jgi:hypothetical protein